MTNMSEQAKRIPYELDTIPESHPRDWELLVNGELVKDVRTMSLTHSAMGIEVNYGLHPAGYDTVRIHERGGGGAVTVPYTLIDGRLHIGVVSQNRPGAGGVVDEIPRGFVDPKETHEDAVVREMAEETGLSTLAERFFELGRHKNPNTAFFDTSAPDEGIRFYGIEITPEELELVADESGAPYYRFQQGIRDQAETKVEERILGSRFVPVGELIHSSDLMTSAGVGLLTTHMLGMHSLRFMSPSEPMNG